MTELLYLVDNNALSKLRSEERTSEVFASCCRIPEDVAYEARGYLEDGLEGLVEPTTIEMLAELVKVMGSERPGDRDLVDLYQNKGSADPSIIACALAMLDKQMPTLFEPVIKIVTDDKAVRRKAEEFKVPVVSAEDFIRLFRPGGKLP